MRSTGPVYVGGGATPVFSRKTLRQNLGLNHLRDVALGTITGSFGQAPGNLNIIDAAMADLSYLGQGLYARSWLRLNTADFDIRVASFNAGSGAYFSQYGAANIAATMHASGTSYERHDLLPSVEKDRAIDDAVKRLRIRREVGFPSVDGAFFYAIDGAASPAIIVNPEDVLDAYYYANPANSLNRDRRELANWNVDLTGSGMEIRIAPRLSGSYQIVLDALVTLTLGAGDAATLNIPDERLVLFGAEAQCWHLLAKTSPGTQRGSYAQSRDEAARAYSDLAAKFKRPVARDIQFDRAVGDGLPAAGWRF